MRKIYISPENRPRPHGKYIVGNTYEHDVCTEIGELLKDGLERCGFYAEMAVPSMSIQSGNTRQQYANAKRFDLYICIHSNGVGSTGQPQTYATGAEMHYYNHPASIKANRCVYDELIKLYPSRRGLKDGSRFAENNRTNMVSVYAELGFHDNPADAAFLVSRKPEIARALCRGICAYFGAAYKEAAQECGRCKEQKAQAEKLQDKIDKALEALQ